MAVLEESCGFLSCQSHFIPGGPPSALQSQALVHQGLLGSWRSLHTNVYWVDFNFIKVVEDRLIIGVDVPVVAQRPEESVLAVVSARHDTLWEVHDPLLQKVVRGIQTTHKLWGEGEGLGSARHSRGGWPRLTNMSGRLSFLEEKCTQPSQFQRLETQLGVCSIYLLFSPSLLSSSLSSYKSSRYC